MKKEVKHWELFLIVLSICVMIAAVSIGLANKISRLKSDIEDITDKYFENLYNIGVEAGKQKVKSNNNELYLNLGENEYAVFSKNKDCNKINLRLNLSRNVYDSLGNRKKVTENWGDIKIGELDNNYNYVVIDTVSTHVVHPDLNPQLGDSVELHPSSGKIGAMWESGTLSFENSLELFKECDINRIKKNGKWHNYKQR